jgi:glycosyltransferase involved in cell wall biosynthesis
MTPPVEILVPLRDSAGPSGGYLTLRRLAAAIRSTGHVNVTEYDSVAIAGVGPLLAGLPDDALVMAGWGPHVPALAEALQGRRFVYWANSVGWFHHLPSGVPVLCASRYTLGYWGEIAPNSPLYYLPNPLEPSFRNEGRTRDIGVLVQTRKSSEYLVEGLVPRLNAEGLRIEVLASPVEDLASALNRARVFLYDSRDHWLRSGVSEGFGLPPLEAIACGCHVFASLNAGLSDYMDPAVVGAKVGNHSIDYDVARIRDACHRPPVQHEDVVREYRYEAVASRWKIIADDLDAFFSHTNGTQASVGHMDLPGPRIYDRQPHRVEPDHVEGPRRFRRRRSTP